MKLTNMEHIPLASAYLCPDCNCIGNCASQCPACASPVLLALANVLNREPERKPILAYTHNNYRSSRRRAFLVAAKSRPGRPQPVGPTPITVNAGALNRAHAPWRVMQHEVEEGTMGMGEGAAS